MASEDDWSSVSFTPTGQSEFNFEYVTVSFPTLTNPLEEESEDYLMDVVGPIPIRVRCSRMGKMPIFPVGTVGTFKCKWKSREVLHWAVNARVMKSKPDDLFLEAESLDAYTTPLSMTRD